MLMKSRSSFFFRLSCLFFFSLFYFEKLLGALDWGKGFAMTKQIEVSRQFWNISSSLPNVLIYSTTWQLLHKSILSPEICGTCWTLRRNYYCCQHCWNWKLPSPVVNFILQAPFCQFLLAKKLQQKNWSNRKVAQNKSLYQKDARKSLGTILNLGPFSIFICAS
jgi:hypothetical protein